MGQKPIVVMTPVKNDDWILELFLAVTTTFADQIIIADQGSSDASRAICATFSKVTLIENPSEEYDEASRQELLLRTARELVPGEKILMALDADELLAADAVFQPGWTMMMRANPGTVLLMEKPDLLPGVDRCIRYPVPFPLGYVDDGAPHQPKRIHSPRVPMPPYASLLTIPDVKVLHYALTRPRGQAAKQRRYSVLENLMGKGTFIGRRYVYAPEFDYTKGRQVATCPDEWSKGWIDQGIDVKTVREQQYYWQDFDVLRQMQKYGARRFWLENIWNVDWEACREFACSVGSKGFTSFRVTSPPRVLSILLQVADILYKVLAKIRDTLERRRMRREESAHRETSELARG